MSRPPKRQRFDEDASNSLKGFCRLGKITNAGLQDLLGRLRRNPELLNATRLDLSSEFYARFEAVRTEIPLDLIDGSIWTWTIADPGLLLQKVVTECPNLRRLYLDALIRFPCTRERPWKLVVGFDEFTPGDKLKVNNQRKCMVLSITFAELGRQSLGKDAVWVTPVVVRHSMIEKVKGGWSRMLTAFLKLMMLGTNGLQTCGFPISVSNVEVVVWGCMGYMFSDGDGLRLALDWKGASGLRPCWRHCNIVSKTSDLQGEEYVDITCADFRRFKVWKTGEIEATVDMLAEARSRVENGTMTQTRCEGLEKACGFNGNPLGLMADVSLRSHFHTFEVTIYDWVHTALQNGTVTEEAFLYCKACRDVGLRSRDIEAFLKDDWIFPAFSRAKGKGLHRVFDDFRAHSSHKADRLKASASEMLGLYGLLRHWSEVEVGDNPTMSEHKASFEAACEVIDIILRCKRGFIEQHAAKPLLLRAIADHMRLHKAIYGTAHIKPKHHWMMDVAEQMGELPCVLDAFIIERLHLRVKKMLEPVKELGMVESSTLAGIMNSQFEEAKKFVGDGLTGVTATHLGVRMADHASIGSLRLASGDAVFNRTELGLIVVLVEDEDILYAVVRGCVFRATVSKYGTRWLLRDGDLKVWPLSHLDQVGGESIATYCFENNISRRDAIPPRLSLGRLTVVKCW